VEGVADTAAARMRSRQKRSPRALAGLAAALRVVTACVRQNSTVDIYESYFPGSDSDAGQDSRAVTLHKLAKLTCVTVVAVPLTPSHTHPIFTHTTERERERERETPLARYRRLLCVTPRASLRRLLTICHPLTVCASCHSLLVTSSGA
jgi:hypothetical protein